MEIEDAPSTRPKKQPLPCLISSADRDMKEAGNTYWHDCLVTEIDDDNIQAVPFNGSVYAHAHRHTFVKLPKSRFQSLVALEDPQGLPEDSQYAQPNKSQLLPGLRYESRARVMKATKPTGEAGLAHYSAGPNRAYRNSFYSSWFFIRKVGTRVTGIPTCMEPRLIGTVVCPAGEQKGPSNWARSSPPLRRARDTSHRASARR